jgi:Ca-activated chloride channel homolog
MRSAVLSLLVSALVLVAADRAHGQEPSFRSGVDMVALTVTVTDAAGQFIRGLTARDLVVYDEGVEQPIALFGSEEVPLDVAFVLDTSSSMKNDLPLVKKAALALVALLRAGDRAAVFEVKTIIGVAAPLTTDRNVITVAVNRLYASGSTSIYDGVEAALRELEHERSASREMRRQALVLLSDGFDSGSEVSFGDVARLARQLDVTIYWVALGSATESSSLSPFEPEDVGTFNNALNSLARETGGLAFFPRRADALEGIYASIARELVTQYAVGYVAPDSGPQGVFRHLSVRVVPPAEGMARTRSGYVRK